MHTPRRERGQAHASLFLVYQENKNLLIWFLGHILVPKPGLLCPKLNVIKNGGGGPSSLGDMHPENTQNVDQNKGSRGCWGKGKEDPAPKTDLVINHSGSSVQLFVHCCEKKRETLFSLTA